MLLVYLAMHSDDKLVFSPSPHLPAKKNNPYQHNNIDTIVLNCSNTVNTSPPGHLAEVLYVFSVCVPMCVFALELRQERILLECQRPQYSRYKERKKDRETERWRQSREAGMQGRGRMSLTTQIQCYVCK